MKPFLPVLLGFLILLSGCYSTYPISKGELSLATDERILIVLRHGRSIEVEPDHHINVTEPSDFIYGVGLVSGVGGATLTSREFRGRLLQSAFDSSAIRGGGLICWLEDGASIFFKENDYVEVTSEEGTGFWCVGEYQDGNLFKGKVPQEDIRGFFGRKSEAFKNLWIVGPFGAVIAATIIIVTIWPGGGF